MGAFFLICLLPVAYMFFATFESDSEIGFDAYKKVLFQARQWTLLWQTAVVALSAVALSLLFGVPFAYLTVKSDLPLRRFFGSIYFIPLIVPPYMIVFSWDRILSERFPLGPWLKEMFELKGALIGAFPLTAASIFLFLSYFPLVILLTRSALSTQDPSFEEAGVFSVSEKRLRRGVTLRLALPGIVTGATFVFIFALSNYGVPNMVQANVYALEVFYQFKTAYDQDAATASAVPLVLLALIPILFQRILEGGRRYSSPRITNREPRIVPLGRWRIPALLFVTVFLIVTVGIPIGMLLWLAGGISSYRGALDVEGLGALPDLLSSLKYAAAAATVAVIIGAFMGILAARSRKLVSGSIDFLSMLPFAFPAGVVGIGLIRLWNRPGIFDVVYTSSAILIIGFLCRFAPFAFRAVGAGLKRVDPAFEEAAEVAGVGAFRRLFGVSFRMALSGMSCAWIIVFILGLGELGMSRLVSPPGIQTMPLRIFSLIHWQYDNYVAALCLLLVGAALLPLVLFYLATGKKLEIR